MNLAGGVAVVTGGAYGVGKGAAARLAERGMKVVLADLDRRTLDAAVAELTDRGFTAIGVECDVADFEANRRVADAAYDAFGGAHVVMLNAGIVGGTFEDDDMANWRRTIGVNLEGVVGGILAFLPRMLASGEPGYLVGTTSGAGAQGTSYGVPAYSATKAAVLSVMESLYGYLRDRQAAVRSAVLFPPMTRSHMGTPEVEAMMKAAGRGSALSDPEELGLVVVEGLERDAFWLIPDAEQDERIFGGRLADHVAGRNRMVMAKATAMVERTAPDPYLWSVVPPSVTPSALGAS